MIKATRIKRQQLRDRRVQNKALRRIQRGAATAATYLRAVGQRAKAAASTAATIKKNVSKAGLTGEPGRAYRKGALVDVTRYTLAQIKAGASMWRPRLDRTKAARLALLAL